MYKWDADNSRWDATHNPFSGVEPDDEALLTTTSGDLLKASPDDPAGRARALQHDLVLNGWELGGGSIRIHRHDLLERSFLLQGHSVEAQRAKFGAVLDAFEYGAPPHGGIALGIDRWIALLTNQVNIREVQAFPKTGTGSDLMLGAPSPVEIGSAGRARPAARPTKDARQAPFLAWRRIQSPEICSRSATVAVTACACCWSRGMVAGGSFGCPVYEPKLA